jgi:hypothetical protein
MLLQNNKHIAPGNHQAISVEGQSELATKIVR